MRFDIYRQSCSTKKPCKAAKFVGFVDDSAEKQYEVEINSIEELTAIAEENKCDLSIWRPVKQDGLWEISVNDVYDDDKCDDDYDNEQYDVF